MFRDGNIQRAFKELVINRKSPKTYKFSDFSFLLVSIVPNSMGLSTFLSKLVVSRLVKEFPTIYGTRSFNDVFNKDLHWKISKSSESSPQLHTHV
jgi:hypothetical protein